MNKLSREAMALHTELLGRKEQALRSYLEGPDINNREAAAKLGRLRRVTDKALDRWARRVEKEKSTDVTG
jgi:hypothetical protein